MGLLLSVVSKFRKKTTTKEILKNIEEDIDKLESTLRKNRQLQKTTVLALLSVSVLAYLLAALVFYLWYLPTKWSERILYLLPFLGFPMLVFFLKKILHFIFVTRITKNRKALEELKKEKKKILENVMETETYKVAKEILQRFDPTRKLVERETPTKETPQKTPGQEIRKRNNIGSPQTPQLQIARSNSVPVPPGQWPMTPAMNGTPRMIHGPGMCTSTPPMHLRFPTPNVRAMTPGSNLPIAPILPRDRSFFDKVAEYFVGDGPSNRYALICKQCFSHNGMALAEEFEFVSYKCCYCGQLNPARKQRLNAPKLENEGIRRQQTSAPENINPSSSDSSKNVNGDVDPEKVAEKKIVNGETEADKKDEASDVHERREEIDSNENEEDRKSEEESTDENKKDR